MAIRSLLRSGLTLLAMMAASSSSVAVERVMIPAGSTGGTVYTWMATATGILNKQQQLIEFSARSGGLVENVALLESGEVKIAATSGFDYFGWTKGKSPMESELRSIFMITPLVSFIVLPKNAPEKSLPELRGKSIQMGPRTSAMYPFNQMVLSALGLNESEFKTFALSAGAGAEAYAEGKVYANLFLTGLPRPPPLERMLQSERGAKMIFYSPEELKRIESKYSIIKTIEVPADQLPGVDAPVRLPALWAELVVRKDFPDAIAYQIAKILHENYQAMLTAFPPAVYSTAENTSAHSAFPMHPGVERYLRENGLLKR